VRLQLCKENMVTIESRPKVVFQKDDQQRCVRVLWTEADPVRHNRSGRMRVMLTAALQLLCHTGAKVSDVFNREKDQSSEDARLNGVRGLRWKVSGRDVRYYAS
jgi:hypothetical protein